jgi:hypothetical protein
MSRRYFILASLGMFSIAAISAWEGQLQQVVVLSGVQMQVDMIAWIVIAGGWYVEDVPFYSIFIFWRFMIKIKTRDTLLFISTISSLIAF